LIGTEEMQKVHKHDTVREPRLVVEITDLAAIPGDNIVEVPVV
jgi:hypothetical protein